MAEILAGFIGEPDEVNIAQRSLRRIYNAVFDTDDLHSNVDRQIGFRAIREPTGINISEVTVFTKTVDGKQVDRTVRVVYRNGLFREAVVTVDGADVLMKRLSDALEHIKLVEV